MNRFRTAAAVMLACALVPLGARAQFTPKAPLSFGPTTPGDTAKYTIAMDYQVLPDQKPPASTKQDVTFTLVDATHVRMSTGTDAASESIVADRSSDGRLHSKLKRGSLLYWPMQIYNKLQSVTAVAAATDPGQVRSGAIPLAESDDSIPGALRIARSAASTTDASIEAAGPVQPRDMPRTANTGKPLPPPDQTSGGGGLRPGNDDAAAKKPAGPVQGDATLKMRATYVDGPLVHAESLEEIVVGGAPAITITRHWSLTKS